MLYGKKSEICKIFNALDFVHVQRKFNENENVWINSYHEGYKDIFSIIHKRLIHIDLKNFVIEAKHRGLNCGVNDNEKILEIFRYKWFFVFIPHIFRLVGMGCFE